MTWEKYPRMSWLQGTFECIVIPVTVGAGVKYSHYWCLLAHWHVHPLEGPENDL